MPTFLLVAHDAPTHAEFPLDDLPGAGGRMDLLARCVIDALLTSHGIREDTRLHVVVGDDLTVRFDGATLRNLHPDERSAAALLRTALAAREDAIGHQPAEPSPGLSLVKMGLETTLAILDDEGTLVRLGPDGVPAAETSPPDDPIFVLSDHRPFGDDELARIGERADRTVSLGPVGLHANQAITVAHNWLDTDGFAAY